MSDFDWKLVRLVAHRCEAGDLKDGKVRKRSVPVMGLDRFNEDHRLLEDLLDGLLSAAWAKKVDITDSSSCRAFPFCDSKDGGQDRALIEEMLGALSLSDFESRALVLAERYAGLPRAREGILLQVVVTIEAGRVHKAPFYALFKCDFEDARQLSQDHGLEKVDEVILAKLKKMAIYPYFDGFHQDADRIKIFQASASDYFHELFEVAKPATVNELIGHEVKEAVQARHPRTYDDYFVGSPPQPRELFGKECFIPISDLLPPLEVQYVNDRSCTAAREKYDRAIRLTIKVDGTTKVEADLAGLGRSLFFAKKGDQKYLIVRGEKFVTKGPLSGLDFLDVQELDDILPRVMEEVTFKEGGNG